MYELINTLNVRETSLNIFRYAFRLYKKIESRKIELSDDDLNRIFERIHAKALEVYDSNIWGSLTVNDNKIVYAEELYKERKFPLVPSLVTYGNAILIDGFHELIYSDEPGKAAVEVFALFFIYAYVNSMKTKENEKLTNLVPPELVHSAIDPLIDLLVIHRKDRYVLSTLSVDLIIEILKLSNSINQAHNMKGLYNQFALNKIWISKKEDLTVGVIMLDGDHFKLVNDFCSHHIGDEVLNIYKDSILCAIEQSDKLKIKTFPARWGGEEFVVCVFDTNEDEMIDLAKRIKSELKQHCNWDTFKIYEKPKEDFYFPRTFSQGIKTGKKRDFDYLNAIVTFADEQMYLAKNEGGRDCIYYENKKVQC
jgi:diguanylate cyclase (GGDEF)-like protein